MEENKKQGIVSILAAIFVMFSAMWDTRVSLVISILALLALGTWKIFVGQKKGAKSDLTKMPDLIAKQEQEKAEHLQKAKDFISGKDKITNNDIQKLLGVSDATAERYLNELEKQGFLRQGGQDKGAFYEKIG